MFVRWLTPQSALARSIDPEGAAWGLLEQLQARAIEGIEGGNWQRAGGKGPKPKPVTRPGVTPEGDTAIGSGAVTLDEIDEFFGRSFRPEARQN